MRDKNKKEKFFLIYIYILKIVYKINFFPQFVHLV